MALPLLVGCGLIAFSPLLAIFTLYIVQTPYLIILSIGGYHHHFIQNNIYFNFQPQTISKIISLLNRFTLNFVLSILISNFFFMFIQKCLFLVDCSTHHLSILYTFYIFCRFITILGVLDNILDSCRKCNYPRNFQISSLAFIFKITPFKINENGKL